MTMCFKKSKKFFCLFSVFFGDQKWGFCPCHAKRFMTNLYLFRVFMMDIIFVVISYTSIMAVVTAVRSILWALLHCVYSFPHNVIPVNLHLLECYFSNTHTHMMWAIYNSTNWCSIPARKTNTNCPGRPHDKI